MLRRLEAAGRPEKTIVITAYAQQLAEANAQSQALVRQLMDEGWSNLANAEFSWQMQFVGPATGATVDEWLKAAEAFCGERLS